MTCGRKAASMSWFFVFATMSFKKGKKGIPRFSCAYFLMYLNVVLRPVNALPKRMGLLEYECMISSSLHGFVQVIKAKSCHASSLLCSKKLVAFLKYSQQLSQSAHRYNLLVRFKSCCKECQYKLSDHRYFAISPMSAKGSY